ncbi:MAG: dipeptide epimerase [Chitinophagales bacterium]|nr:dipeptide epimerase [Chitinophagales bacterium]
MSSATIRCYPYRLQFRRPFRIAAGSRTHTDSIYVSIEQYGKIGYGEAALPPYLQENTLSVMAAIARVKNSISIQTSDEPPIKTIHAIKALLGDQPAAIAALELAMWDLHGQLVHQPLYQCLGIEQVIPVQSTYTIGIGDESDIRQSVADAHHFALLKLKLGSSDDKKAVKTLKQFTDKPFCVDVNQGWNDWRQASDMAFWLHEQGAFLLEQPLPKHRLDDIARIAENSPIPIILDESVRRFSDIRTVYGACQGINIKLMKSGGVVEAKQMIALARELGMKVLVGCMSESSCAVSAAAHLSGLCDWADLDGPYLIVNDPFDGVKIDKGYIHLPNKNGIGIELRGKLEATSQ